ncbi:glycosyltransferase family 88 protein [Legionella waltersii]|uniref:Putative glucosyltransferase Lgt1 n=1 Tax=Legionella waltersii TaxID=66969 RepID=A0A0W1A2Q3_9GAMM|nr:glycosyltransferase family 88 protein [Legionella waltersii]KTD75283.1 putative glucosyltransferase Lgt1 [Legionella waltersii]SNV06915.1 putative glucosyltransferase Lgt1 [Legionella waltersii]
MSKLRFFRNTVANQRRAHKKASFTRDPRIKFLGSLSPLNGLIMKAIHLNTNHNYFWNGAKQLLFMRILHSPLAMSDVSRFDGNLLQIQRWLTQQLKSPTPIWSQAWKHPIRKAWATQAIKNHSLHLEDREQFADVTVCGFKIDPRLPYRFNPTSQIAIWFSTSPNLAIRDKEKSRLIERGLSVSNRENVLVYSSILLDDSAKEDMKIFSSKHQIVLIDIDDLNITLSNTSRELLQLARLELSHLGKGGNPAAASDLIRWIPEIMKGSVYADIDLPIDDSIVEQPMLHPSAGLPVVCNMGSFTYTTLPSYQQAENCTINTDIIAYSDHSDTELFMESVAKHILQSYKNPFQTLVKSKAPICETQAFKNMLNTPKATLFDLRKMVSDCSTLKDFYHLLGRDLFRNTFRLSANDLESLQICFKYNSTLPSNLLKNMSQINSQLKDLRTHYYKALVEEISGPGAIYRAFGGIKLFHNGAYRKESLLPVSNARALEGFGCVNNMTSFVSDNIPSWRLTEEEFNKRSFNEDGLSWISPPGR